MPRTDHGAPDLVTFTRALRAIRAPAGVVVDSLAAALAGLLGVPAPATAQRSGRSVPIPDIPEDLVSPWLLGQAREVLHRTGERQALGAWFTPAGLARQLVDRAAVGGRRPGRVLDPACGGGAFLLAAFERFPDAYLTGVDIDPLAVRVTRAALELAGCTDHDIRCADALTSPVPPADLVVGNPPFLSQLQRRTARDDRRRRALVGRFGPAASGYVDEAAVFLLATATALLAPRGTAVLIVPEALLATAGHQRIRKAIDQCCEVEVVWRDTARIFDGVPACAIRLTAPASEGRLAAIPWATRLATEVPAVCVETGHTVGEVATATADFRDAYYLLADHVEEAPLHAAIPTGARPIVTAGLIDPAHLRWGEAPVRFAKRRWQRPVAAGLPAGFLAARTGPKLLLATQTRVLEAVVDHTGNLLSSTPVITVRSERLWHVGAALTSPVLTAVAARRHAGAARSRGALKLSARQVLDLPLPPSESRAWDQAAQAYRHAHDVRQAGERRRLLHHCGALMMQAYGVEDGGALGWWLKRLPRR